MSIEFSCSCGKKYKLRDELAGKKAKCAQCGKVLEVPMPPEPEAEVEPDGPVDIYAVEDPVVAEPESSVQSSYQAGSQNVAVAQRAYPQASDGFVQNGRLAVQEGAQLPDRCIKCNCDAAEGRMTKRLAYNLSNVGPGAARFIPFIGRFVRLAWMINQAATRQHLTISFCVCKRHRMQRVLGFVAMAIGLIAGIAIVALAAPTNNTPMIVVGIIVFVLGGLCGKLTNLLTVAVPLHNGAELTGAGKSFLDSLPRAGKKRMG